jgi:hypothetical protein
VTTGVVVEEVVTVGVDTCVGSDGTGTDAPADVPVPVSTETPTEPLFASSETDGVGDEPPLGVEPLPGAEPPPLPPPPLGGAEPGGAVGTGAVGVGGCVRGPGSVGCVVRADGPCVRAVGRDVRFAVWVDGAAGDRLVGAK